MLLLLRLLSRLMGTRMLRIGRMRADQKKEMAESFRGRIILWNCHLLVTVTTGGRRGVLVFRLAFESENHSAAK